MIRVSILGMGTVDDGGLIGFQDRAQIPKQILPGVASRGIEAIAIEGMVHFGIWASVSLFPMGSPKSIESAVGVTQEKEVIPGNAEDAHSFAGFLHPPIAQSPVILRPIEGVPGEESFCGSVGVAAGEVNHEDLVALGQELNDGPSWA